MSVNTTKKGRSSSTSTPDLIADSTVDAKALPHRRNTRANSRPPTALHLRESELVELRYKHAALRRKLARAETNLALVKKELVAKNRASEEDKVQITALEAQVMKVTGEKEDALQQQS